MKAIAEEGDAFASFIVRRTQDTFQLLRIATADSVAVAFYRRERSATENRSLLAVVLDESSPGTWTALGAQDVSPGGSRGLSIRPSERGDWIRAVYGSAPPETNTAIIDLDGHEQRVAVESGVFAFFARSETEPEATLTRLRFE